MHGRKKTTGLSRAAQSRLEPLRAAQLQFAPRSVQQAFWAQTNRRSRRSGPVPLADSLGEFMSDRGAAASCHASRVGSLLQAVIPLEMLAEIEVGPLHRGTLTLHAASGAAAYECERTYATLLVQACREAAPELRISSVRFQVGRA